MKKSILFLTFFVSFAFANQSAEALFDAKCSSCHSKTRPTDMSKVTAPAIMGVMRHVKMAYPDKEKAVKFISEYVLNPTKEKSICNPRKLERFGVMPSLKGVVSEEEVQKIASWLYDNFPPKGFRGGMHKGFKNR
jgi:mono/diheme cytochrome c family protein